MHNNPGEDNASLSITSVAKRRSQWFRMYFEGRANNSGFGLNNWKAEVITR